MWQTIAARYGFQLGMLGGHLAEAAVTHGMRGRKRGVLKSLAPALGFAGAQVGISELLRPYEEKYEEYEQWPERRVVQGFNPQTWGTNSEVGGYGLGNRQNSRRWR